MVEYWKSLPKSNQHGGGKPGQNKLQTFNCSNKRSFGSVEVKVFRRNQWQSKWILWYVKFHPVACTSDLTLVDGKQF